MSFYCGPVAKLVQTVEDPTVWEVVDVINIDTNRDENMNINFSHSIYARATFIPTEIIENFDLHTTKNVERIFDYKFAVEKWRTRL
jgi:hypothetical protein